MTDLSRSAVLVYRLAPMGFLSNWFGGSSGTSLFAPGENRRDALGAANPLDLSMVVACRQLIADTVASFKLEAVDDKTGEPLERQPPIVRRPDPSEPSSDTFEKVCNDMTGVGQSVLRITAFGTDDRPIALQQIRPQRVTWTLTDDGQGFSQFLIDGEPQTPGTLLVVPMILNGNTPVGQSPLAQINNELLQLNAANLFAMEYLGGAATPLYALTAPNRLQEGQAEELIAAWTEAREKRRPAVISGNFDLKTYEQISIRDALLLDAVNNLDARIARVMQVPPSLVNATAQSNLTYSTARQEAARWLQLGLDAAYLQRLEAAFTELLPRGQVARFNTGRLTRLDESERLDKAIKGLQADLFDLDEARAFVGLPAADARLRGSRNVDTRVV